MNEGQLSYPYEYGLKGGCFNGENPLVIVNCDKVPFYVIAWPIKKAKYSDERLNQLLTILSYPFPSTAAKVSAVEYQLAFM